MNDLLLSFADLDMWSAQLATAGADVPQPSTLRSPHGEWLASPPVTSALEASNRHLALRADYAAADAERIAAFPRATALEMSDADHALSGAASR